MPKASAIARPAILPRYSEVLVRRDGLADLLIKRGRLVLSVDTVASTSRQGARWKVYRVFEVEPDYMASLEGKRKAVVAEEGHSTVSGEMTRYAAYVCKNGVEIWEAMGKMEELKPVLTEMKWQVIEEL
jgi:hypothetical protein